MIPKFAARILRGLPPVIFGDGSQTRDFTWVEETARGIVAATACDELVGEAVNIAFGRGVSSREICDRCSWRSSAPTSSRNSWSSRPGDVEPTSPTRARLAASSASRPGSAIREGLERYVDWVRQSEAAELAHAEAVRNW